MKSSTDPCLKFDHKKLSDFIYTKGSAASVARACKMNDGFFSRLNSSEQSHISRQTLEAIAAGLRMSIEEVKAAAGVEAEPEVDAKIAEKATKRPLQGRKTRKGPVSS